MMGVFRDLYPFDDKKASRRDSGAACLPPSTATLLQLSRPVGSMTAGRAGQIRRKHVHAGVSCSSGSTSVGVIPSPVFATTAACLRVTAGGRKASGASS